MRVFYLSFPTPCDKLSKYFEVFVSYEYFIHTIYQFSVLRAIQYFNSNIIWFFGSWKCPCYVDCICFPISVSCWRSYSDSFDPKSVDGNGNFIYVTKVFHGLKRHFVHPLEHILFTVYTFFCLRMTFVTNVFHKFFPKLIPKFFWLSRRTE